MNYSVIRNILGKIMLLVAILMCFPLIICIWFKEELINYLSFIIPMILLVGIGYLFTHKKALDTKISVREGFIVVAATWFVISLFGCIPFMISGEIPNFFDAFFEITSGFTTTGSTILTDITKVSHSVLFWRSFSQWIGGMGVLVFILAIIPESKDGTTIHILRAESTGPQVGKLVSKMQVTSRILYLIYLFLTIVLILLLWLGPDKEMKLFNSIIYGLSTAGTGGFSIDQFSLELYSSYSHYIIGIFMIIFSINFSLFYLLLIGRIKEIFKFEEVKWFIIIVVISIFLILFNIISITKTYEEAFRFSFFQVASIISTSGYSIVNYDDWPSFSKIIIIILMFMGGCAGSTAGGMKTSRIMILSKSTLKRIKSTINPRKVETVYFNGNPLNDNIVDSVQSFFIVYMFFLIFGTLIISLDGIFDFETNFTATLACLSNIGPGLGVVGPYGSFAGYSNFSKFILSIIMIAGRLEIFPILILFNPRTWIKRI